MKGYVKTGLMFTAVFLVVTLFSLWLAWPVVTETTVTQTMPGAIQGGMWDGILTLIGGIFAVTIVFLLLIYFGLQRFIIGFMIFAMFWLAAGAILFTVIRIQDEITLFGVILSVCLAGGMVAWGYRKKDALMLNIVGGLGIAWAAASLGSSFSPLTAVIILDILAAYDAISVYGTKHMLTLAKGIAAGGMPIGVMIFGNPRGQPLDFNVPRTQRTWQVLGWGDIAIPGVFVVSANLAPFARLPGGLTFMSAGALVGAVAGFFLLGWIAERFPRPGHAGLPPLIGCAEVGAVIGWLIGMFL